MPEGLVPVSVESVDEMMENVLGRYTLRGMNVLAHCRGGVGRVSAMRSSCCAGSRSDVIFLLHLGGPHRVLLDDKARALRGR